MTDESSTPPQPAPGAVATQSGTGADADQTRFDDAATDGDAGSPPPAAAGRALGRFRIEGTLGHGGMGTVYRAFDPTLNRHVALKVPRFDAVGDSVMKDLFLREARAAAAVTHPNLVEVYEAGMTGAEGDADRQCYLASSLCEGPNLAKWLEDRTEPVAPAFAAALLAPLADAVHRCHQAGVVHRDLKPANVLLDAPGAAEAVPATATDGPLPFVPRISDFGVARVLEEGVTAALTSRAVGTPLYMAPEQAGGRPEQVGPATDVWALGAIFYELLTGRPPFEGVTTLALLRSIEEDDPPAPRTLRPGLPAGLGAICMKCLRKRPEERYGSAAELAADLTAWREGRAVSARPFGWRDRLDTWSRRPERLRDAGVFILMWNAAFAVGMALMSLDVGLGGATALPQHDALMAEGVAGSLMSAATAFLGYGVLRGSRWAWRLALVVTIGMTIYTSGGWIWGGGAGFSIYDQLPAAKYLVMISVTAGVVLQLVALLLSTRARVQDRRG